MTSMSEEYPTTVDPGDRLVALAAETARKTPFAVGTLVCFQIETIKTVIAILRDEAASWGAADGDAVTWIRFSATFLERLITADPEVFARCSRCLGLTPLTQFRGLVCVFCAQNLEGVIE
jgi:hypothetical protein